MANKHWTVASNDCQFITYAKMKGVDECWIIMFRLKLINHIFKKLTV